MKNIKYNIYVGDKQDAQDSEKLSEENIQTVINLTKDSVVDADHMNRRSYRSFHLLDNGANPQEQVDAAIYSVAGEIESRDNFLVHCAGGISRSPTILAAAIALVEEKSLDEAIEYMKHNYEPTNPHPDLKDQVEKSLDRFRNGVSE